MPERETRPIEPFPEDLGRDDPDVRLARRERARAVRAEHRHAARPDVGVDAQHLVRGQALGDADHGADPRVDGLVDRVGGEARRNEDHRRVRAGRLDGVDHGVEDRDALDVLAALAGRDAGDDLRAVALVPEAVEGALGAGQALDDELRLLVDDDRHQPASSLQQHLVGRRTRRPRSGRRAARGRARLPLQSCPFARATARADGASRRSRPPRPSSPAASRNERHSCSE